MYDMVDNDMTIETWLKIVREIADECQNKSKVVFLDRCREEGLVIENEETFLRIYWNHYKADT